MNDKNGFRSPEVDEPEQAAVLPMDDLLTLEACREIELASARIYEIFAETFAADSEAAELWRKTAAEEHNHAAQILLAARVKGLVAGVSADRARAIQARRRLMELQGRMLMNPPSLAEALRLALQLEEALTEFHSVCLAIFEEERHRNMFQAMMDADVEHIETIRRYAERVASTPPLVP